MICNCSNCKKKIETNGEDYNNLVYCFECMNDESEKYISINIDLERKNFVLQEKLNSLQVEYKNNYVILNKLDYLIDLISNKKKSATKNKKGLSKKEREVFWKNAKENKCNICGYIGKRKDFHIDHIIPLKKGGTNCLDNLQILCIGCNLAKKAYIITPPCKLRGFIYK